MAKKRKKKTTSKPRPIETTSRTTQIRLVNIARKLGTSVPALLESYGDAETIIEKFDTGSLSLLTEEDVSTDTEQTTPIGDMIK